MFVNLTENQRINGSVNAHLISGPSISTKHTKSNKNGIENLGLDYSSSFIYSFSLHINQIQGHRMQ